MRKVILLSCFMTFLFRGFSQVGLQSGSAVFSMPIQSWQDTKSRLNTSVTLQYSSNNGLKADDVPSNIGQGWDLSAGGVVVRMQVGQPDDQKPKDGPYSDITKYPPGYLYNTAPISNGCPSALKDYPIFGSSNVLYKPDNVTVADREQDYFAFRFNGRNGVFVLGKMTSATGGKAIFLGDSKMKAWYDIDEGAAASQHLRTTISAFHIQDENGLIYTFRDKALTKIQKMHYATIYTDPWGNAYPFPADPPNFQPWNVYFEAPQDEIAPADNPYVTGSWYLSEIKDPLTSRVVTFSYHTETLNVFAGTNVRGVGNSPYVIVSLNNSITLTPMLDQIICPDGTTTTLVYGASRADLPGDHMLTNIKVSYQGRPASQFDFIQSYMIKSQVRQPTDRSEWRFSRLCLVSVKKWGADNTDKEPAYSFAYNTGTDDTENCVPPPFCEVRDIWGYYNGNQHAGFNQSNGQTVAPSPFDMIGARSFYDYATISYMYENTLHTHPNPTPAIKPGYAALGLLKSITYPAGGSLTYTYAQNRGLFPGDAAESDCAGVHVSQTLTHDGTSSTSSDIVTNYDYKMSDNSSSIWGLEKPINLRASNTSFYPESQYVTLTGCDYSYKYAGIESIDEATNLTSAQQFLAILSKILGYAGLGMDIGEIIYSSITTGNPYIAIVEFVFDLIGNFAISCNQYTTTYTNWVYYNMDLNASNALPIQFKRAVVSQGAAGSANGQVIHEFTSPDDYAVLVTDNTLAHSQKQRALPWVYGLEKRVTVTDGAGNTLKQTETDYDLSLQSTKRVIDDGTGSPSKGSCSCYPVNQHSRGSDSWTTAAYINTYESQPTADMGIDPYSLYTGRAPLTDVYDRTFKDANNKLETHTHYDYSPNNYLPQKITTTLSNGDNSIKEIYYASDYAATGIFQTLSSNNLVNLPVASFNSILKNQTCHDCPPSQPIYLGASIYNYSAQGNGDIKADKAYTSWSRVANQLGSPGNFGFDAGNPLNYPNLVQTQQFKYDGITGNLVKKMDEGGRVVTHLYDYNDKYMIAQVVNADPDVDKVAYSSFETDNTGLWTVNGPGSYKSSNSITGSAGFTLGANSLTASLTIGKPYILSFWAYTGSQVVVSGNAVLKKTGPTNNNFTYYEYAVAAGSAAPTVSGSGAIDELRLYPANARMTTYTYDPVLGKTAECDINNRIAYYEYDSYGRLHIIRDEQSNIIKLYEYNYKQ